MHSQSTMAILLSRGTPRVPQHDCAAQSPPAHGVPNGVFGAHLSRLVLIPIPHILSIWSSTVHLADIRPWSHITLAYEFIAHTGTMKSTHAIYCEAGHALACVYRFLSFPICQLGSHNIALSHCFFPDDALNPPSSLPPPYPRRHVCVDSMVKERIGLL